MATKGIVSPLIEEADVHAFQALAAGVASEAQQKRAGNWLLTEAARVLADTYAEVKAIGGDHDDVVFALGRRHVGILMREMLLPSTLERARQITKALHPEANQTRPAGKPTLSARRRQQRQPK